MFIPKLSTSLSLLSRAHGEAVIPALRAKEEVGQVPIDSPRPGRHEVTARARAEIGAKNANSSCTLRAAQEEEGRGVLEATARADNELTRRKDLVHTIHQFPLLSIPREVPSRISDQVCHPNRKAT